MQIENIFKKNKSVHVLKSKLAYTLSILHPRNNIDSVVCPEVLHDTPPCAQEGTWESVPHHAGRPASLFSWAQTSMPQDGHTVTPLPVSPCWHPGCLQHVSAPVRLAMLNIHTQSLVCWTHTDMCNKCSCMFTWAS